MEIIPALSNNDKFKLQNIICVKDTSVYKNVTNQQKTLGIHDSLIFDNSNF